MQAIQILTPGGADALTLVDIPKPTPGPGEALIRIEAAGVNFIDVYLREGRYPAPLPYTLGQEAAGVVESVGDGVTLVRPGDRVAWCSVPGTYAQYAVAPAARLVHIPDGVTTQQAASAMLQGMTAHYLAESSLPYSQRRSGSYPRRSRRRRSAPHSDCEVPRRPRLHHRLDRGESPALASRRRRRGNSVYTGELRRESKRIG